MPLNDTEKKGQKLPFIQKIYSMWGNRKNGVGQEMALTDDEGKEELINPQEVFSINFDKRKDILDKFNKIIEENEVTVSGESIGDSYFNQKIKEKTVLLVGLGKNVRGNLQYILNVLNSSDKFKGFHIYVRVSEETESIVKEYITQNNWHRTKTVLRNKKYRDLMESAKYLITEVYFPEAWVKKPEQVYINIWHGTPLKKLGLAKNSQNTHKNGITQKNFIDADYLLYPNCYTKEKMLESYKVSQLMEGQSLMLGYPRTGGMLEASESNQIDIRNILAPNGEKIYAYMPTFKDWLKVEEVVAQSKELLDYLDENLREDQILYVNLHHKVSDSIDYSKYVRVKKFPPTVDSYKLLAETKALLTDYSSVFFDYLALRKHIILYIEDYEQYKKKRGVYMDLMDFPFDKVRTKEEVLAALNRGKTYDDKKVYQDFCQYDSTANARKLCQLVLDEEEGLLLEEIPKNSKNRVLFYSEVCKPGKYTKLLHGIVQTYDKEENEIYLSCDIDKVDEDKSAAFPMFFECPVIGTGADPHLTAIGKAVKELYLGNKLTFEEAMEYLKYDYALMLQRMFGRAKFDTVVIYDVDNPEKVIALAQSGVQVIMFLPSYVLGKIVNGDRFLWDAVCYASRFCEKIITESKELKGTAESFLGDSWKGKVQVANTVSKLCSIIFQK